MCRQRDGGGERGCGGLVDVHWRLRLELLIHEWRAACSECYRSVPYYTLLHMYSLSGSTRCSRKVVELALMPACDQRDLPRRRRRRD